jgi:hypothetical protein
MTSPKPNSDGCMGRCTGSASGSDSDLRLSGRGSGWSCRGDCSAAIEFSANAVVSPRLPILTPVEPYLYIQLGPHPPSSHCNGSSSASSRSRRTPTAIPANTRIESANASPAAPARSSMRSRRSGASCPCRHASALARRSCEAKKRKHSAVS